MEESNSYTLDAKEQPAQQPIIRMGHFDLLRYFANLRREQESDKLEPAGKLDYIVQENK